MAEPELLTTAQVLDLLQIGRTKLWELVRTNAFPAYRIGASRNGHLRFKRVAVLSWLERQRIRDEVTSIAPRSPASHPPE